jgi:uncharacterized membrane protein YfcA
MDEQTSPLPQEMAGFCWGGLIGALGGLIGLGGAEYRLPVLIGFFGFPALEAVILNKAMSLVVVATALPFRTGTIPFATIADHWREIATLLAGSLLGAWLGADKATKLQSETLYRVIAVLLAMIAGVLLIGHGATANHPLVTGTLQTVLGIGAGFLIGVVAALLGVAGGELLIPTLVLLFGADIKLAGSLSLAVSLPTMLVSLSRYSRDQSFSVLGRYRSLVIAMAIGSMFGTFLGGQALGVVPSAFLLPALSLFLLVAAWKIWQHA